MRIKQKDLRRADFRFANLSGATLVGVDLEGANLSGSNLQNAKLGGARLVGAQLSKADLTGADLAETDLTDASLTEAKLRNAVLLAANLESADLTRADLSGANLGGVSLRGSALREADLTEANLAGASFRATDLGAARFSGVRLGWTVFSAVDLSRVTGLETAQHGGPSTIGVDTLYLSRGRIPEEFLRGCGVPDALGAAATSTATATRDYYSCFISHSHRDGAFVDGLYQRMRRENLRVWLSSEDVAGGKKLHEQIDEAIKAHDKLLVVLSTNSMASEWVKTEIHKARQREIREKCRILFPIGIAPFDEIRRWEFPDADTGKDLARELREYFIPDFSDWTNAEAFERAFERLLRDLRASDDKP